MSETPILTKKMGRGRAVVSVSARCDGSGHLLEYGLWSPTKRRVLNREEEATYRKCHFREAHPAATYDEKRAFDARIRLICGVLEIPGGECDGSGAVVEAVRRVAKALDALVVLGAGVEGAVAVALAAALGERVYRAG